MNRSEPQALKAWFNEHKDHPRLISIMSPTCGFCLIGHQTTKTITQWLGDTPLQVHRVWIPIMEGDDEAAAQETASTWQHDRVADSYDGDHEVGRLFRDHLGLGATAWDTYLLYEPGVTWDGDEPPQASEVQYQLWSDWAEDESRLLTPSNFWWRAVEIAGRKATEWTDNVPAIVRWINEDTGARVGREIPERFLQEAPAKTS